MYLNIKFAFHSKIPQIKYTMKLSRKKILKDLQINSIGSINCFKIFDTKEKLV
jgi:hypothetical protein